MKTKMVNYFNSIKEPVKIGAKVGVTIYLIVAMAFLLFNACAMPEIDINYTTQEVLVRASARVFGNKFAVNNPDKVDLARSYCEIIKASDNPQHATQEALSHLNDPLLEATINDIISLIKIERPDFQTDVWNVDLLLAAVGAFEEGMDMAQEDPMISIKRGETVQIDDETTAEDWMHYKYKDDNGLWYLGGLYSLENRPPTPPGMFSNEYFIEMGM